MAHSLVPEGDTAGPSTTLPRISGRDEKFEGSGPPWLGWKWMDRVEKANCVLRALKYVLDGS
jgi:hypothetical protein